MNIDFIRTLYDYNYRARDVVLDCARSLTDAQYHQPLDYSMGSIHAQLVHTMAAEAIWFSRLRGLSPTRMHAPDEFPTLTALIAHWDEVVKPDVYEFLDDLTPEILAGEIEYKRTGGEPQRESVIGLLTHVVNHGTDHRAQILAMIHSLGGQTAAQDLIYHLRGVL